MTPQELKNSILQLAIQGKLVEQRPEEGTAEELYKQIQAEKQALIKAGKIKKEKPLPEIAEDEIPFDIPENWKWVRVASVAVLNPKNELSDDVETAFVPMPCVSDGYRNEHTYEIKKWGEIKKGFTHFADGDIGVAKITPCFQNRKSVIFRDLPNGCGAGTTELSIVRVPDAYMIREYMLWFFKSEYFISNGKKSFTGTAGQQRIHKDYLAQCVFPLPPLAEQKRIVAKIEELLPLIDRYEQAWTRLEDFNKRFPDDMQKSLLQMAIQGKLVEQRPEDGTGEELYQQIQKEKQALIKAGKIKKEKPLPEITEDEIPFDIPESWKWVRLVELGNFSSGKTPTMGEAKYWANGNVQWFTSKDMKKKYLDESEMKITELAAEEMTKYPAGTLLMVVRSGILKRMLPLCILTKESTINQDLKAYRLYDTSISEYVFYMIKGLETYILQNYRKQVTTVDSLKFDEFSREMKVPLPPLAEQKRIVAQLEELLPLCDLLK